VTTVSCPTCQQPVEWTTESKWRPFCSERCRLLDLGAWMSEQRAIPGDELSAGDDGGDAGGNDPPLRH
jgi:hypothetical protein